MKEERCSCGCSISYPLMAIIGLLIVCAALLAVGLNKPIGTAGGTSDLQRDTLSVSGNSEISVAPDEAYVYLKIVTENLDAKKAQAENGETANSVMAALKAWGAKDDQIETSDYSLEKVQEWDSKDSKYVDKGYRVTNIIKVTTAKINDVGSLVDAGVEAGANGVDSVSFGLSKDSQKAARDNALVKAADAAKQKAQKLADASGTKLGKAITVNEQSYYYAPYQVNVRNSMYETAAGAAPTPISPQKVSVTSSVSIVYELA